MKKNSSNSWLTSFGEKMANERTYPCLPCHDIDEAITFYQHLGFTHTYRQLRPNPYAVVQREDIHIHLFGMPEFDPANSYGTVIIVVPDPDALYHAFAEGLRAAYKKLPISGIPRILRPRKKFGTVYGFSVVDVGGNWLRISKIGDTEPEPADEPTSLLGFVHTAARLGDSRGDDSLALKTLENGLKRYPDAPALERAKAYLYRAELAARLQNKPLAQTSLAAVATLPLTPDERQTLAGELAQTTELVSGLN
jgi:catechol 2,3-dioxygenase-like lactoylglutathione lyase family enzyme